MTIPKIIFLGLLLLSVTSCKNEEREQRSPKQAAPEEEIEKEDPQKRLVDIKIEVENPQPGEEISSPYIITGKARGNWYFEGSFPIFLVDEANNELAVAIAQAQGQWMTEEDVNFKAELSFEDPEVQKAFLRFERANPSGKTEFDEFIKVPVILKEGEMQKME